MRQILDGLRQALRRWWRTAQFAVLLSLATPEQKRQMARWRRERLQGQTDTQRHYTEVMARRRFRWPWQREA